MQLEKTYSFILQDREMFGKTQKIYYFLLMNLL